MYKNFINYLDSKKTILVCCKGELKQEIPDNCDLYIGVKQSIAILPKKDILVMNDFEGLFGLEECLKDIKYIVCPNKIHIKHLPNDNTILLDYLNKYNFTGEIINYELQTNPNPDKKYKYLSNIQNSGYVIYHFLEMCKTNFIIDVYGMYNTLNDNINITNLILNANVNEKYQNLYKRYIEVIYKNKANTNKKMFIVNDKNYKQVFRMRRKYLKKEFNLNINFVD